MKGKISEVFESVQGEGLYLGERQLFVRFFGCNLGRCQFCDTKVGRFREYAPGELLEELVRYKDGCNFISFTGGEPLLQNDFLKEISRLTHERGFKNYLETNGTLPDALEETIDYLDIVAMDLKLPSSTGLNAFWDMHRRFLKIASCKEVFLKTVICHSTSKDELKEALRLIKEINNSVILVLQPNSYENGRRMQEKLKNFKEICIRDNIVTCVIPQMHEMIGLR
ncbi:MAG: 7-carboxy-7-deazaguanine synthase QueE [Candidatus Omnitrophica bacterium]|nr:7-carboxy-7-deazaguanine synthase QueE [Candidatus Omnitrophota bacterium]